MAQVIKLKRSAVAGKTPQTSSLELGELGINTSDGKIYFHRSSSSDDSIQSVLTTDATITGSLKLSGSQHISGSTNIMDDLTYGGNLTASLGSTSSFDRIISVGTSSIGYLIASGSNVVTTPDLTGSFASGSDVQGILDTYASGSDFHQILAESSSYLVNSDTASLGKVTLVSDITGSITSTASFGKILGDGSDLENVADPTAISGSFQGGGSNLISGSILSTGSFGKLVVADLNYPITDGTDGQALITDGSGVLTFDDIKSVAIVKNISGTTLEKGTPVHAVGSVGNTPTVIAASASVASTMPATFVLDEQLVDDAEGRALLSGLINGVNTVGFVEGGVVYVGETGGYTQTKPTGTNLIQNIGIVTKIDANGSVFIYGSGRSNDVPNLLNDHIFFGSGSNQMQQIHISGAIDQSTLNNINLTGDISSSITSTASFGLFVGDGSGLSNVSTETGSFASGSDVQGILDTYASGSDLHQILAESSSYVVESETGSFASGSDVQTIKDTYASGSDLQIILAESASYLNNDTTSSFGAVSMNSTLFVQGDITTSGSVVAQQFRTEFVSESIIFASGSTQFGDSSDDKHRYTGSIEITGSNVVFSSGSKLGIGKTPGTALEIESPDPKIKLGHSEENTNLTMFVSDNTGTVLQSTQEGAKGRIDLRGYGSGSGGSVYITARETSLESGRIGVGIGINSPKVELQVEGAISSSGNVDVVSISGSKLTTIKGDNLTSISGSITSTGSFGKLFGDGSDLENVADPEAISGSYLGLLSGSDDLTLGGGVSGSITSTASFGLFVGDGSGLSNVSTETGSFASGSDVQGILDTYASGSDLHQILAESSSYVVESETGSFVVNSQTGSFASGSDLQIILAESASYVVSTNTGSFLQNSDTASFATLDVVGNISSSASSTSSLGALNLHNTLSVSSQSGHLNGGINNIPLLVSRNNSITSTLGLVSTGSAGYSNYMQFLTSELNQMGSVGFNLATNNKFVIANNMQNQDMIFQVKDAANVSREALRIDASANRVGIYNSTPTKELVVSGAISASGDLFIDDINTTGTFTNTSGTLKISQSISDADIEISVNDGGTTKRALTIDGSDAGSFILGNNLRMGDNQKIRLGTANDFNLYHDSSNSYIYNDTGKIIIQNAASDEDIEIKVSDSGSLVNAIIIDTSEIANVRLPNDGQKLSIGAGYDLQLHHTSGNSFIANAFTGDLYIQNSVDDKDIVLRTDDGSGGVTAYLTLDGSVTKTTLQKDISGSLGTTGSFDRLEGVTLNATISPFASGSDVSQIQAQTGSYASGSDLHQILAESSSYVVESETGSFVVNSQTGSFASGSDLQVILAESASYVVSTNTGSFLQNTDTASLGATTIDSTLFVQGNISTSGSITAQEYIVNSSVTNVTQSFSSGSTIFGDSIDDTHKFTGSLSVSGGLSFPLSGSTITFDGEGGNTQITAPSDTQLQLKVKGVQGINIYNTGVIVNEGGTTVNFRVEGDDDPNLLFTAAANDKVNIGSSTFGDEKLKVAGNTGITGSLFVSSSITTEANVTASGATIGSTTTGSFTLSELNVIGAGMGITLASTNGTPGMIIRDNRASNNSAIAQRSDGRLSLAGTQNSWGSSGIEITSTGRVAVGGTSFGRNDGSLIERFLVHGSAGITGSLHTSGSITTQANISGSITSTGSFGSLVVNGNVDMPDSAILTLGNSSDIQLVHNGTDNFIQTFGAGNLYIRNNADDKDILFQSDDDSGGVKTYLQLDGSEGNVRIPDSVEFNLGSSQDLRILHDGSNSQIKNYTGTLFISNLGTDGDIIFQVDQGGVDNRIMVLDGSREAVAIGKRTDGGTLDPGDDKLLVAGDVGVTGSLFVSSSITTQGDLRIPATNKLYFDGGTHTYISETADDTLKIFVGGQEMMKFTEGADDRVEIGSTSHLKIQDGKALIAGDSDDLVIQHSAGHSFIDNHTGDLIIQNDATDKDVILKSDDGADGMTAYITLDGSTTRTNVHKDLRLDNSVNLQLGSGGDMSLSHDGSGAVFSNAVGNLTIQTSTDDGDVILKSDDGSGGTTAYITLDGSLSLNVLNTNTRVPDSVIIGFGNSSDLQIYHNGTNSFGADNYTGHLIFQNRADDQDIIFKNDDGAGGVTDYITLDGSTTDLSLTPPGITHLLEANTGTPASTYAAPLSASLVIEDDATPTKNSIVIKTHNVGEDNVIGALKFVSSPDGTNYNWNGIEAIAGASGQAQDLVFYTSDSNTGGVTSTERLRITENQITASIASTASFGRIEADSYNLATLSEVSGGLSSTGSFGQLIIQKEGSSGASYGSYNFRNTAIFEGSNASGATIAISAKNTGYSGIFFGDQDNSTQGQLQFDHTTNKFRFVEGGVVMMEIDTSGNTSLPEGNLNVTGSINVSGSVLPVGDNSGVQDIGSSSKRWNDVFAVQTTVGAVFETGLRSKGIGKEETGTIVVWRNGKLVPCDTSEDTMVMGVVKQGKDEPIVMGAEPVLVTGDVKEGDFITTSTKSGHGKKIESGYLLKKEMFGKVIAQALENASGDSSLIKCMIRKM